MEALILARELLYTDAYCRSGAEDPSIGAEDSNTCENSGALEGRGKAKRRLKNRIARIFKQNFKAASIVSFAGNNVRSTHSWCPVTPKPLVFFTTSPPWTKNQQVVAAVI